MTKIRDVKAHQILDSRGNPTIETRITLDNGAMASDSVPSGASTGALEAVELRDHDPKNFGGMSVNLAIDNINRIIAPRIIGMDPSNQKDIDNAMISLDGTPNKAKLGANSILSVSLAAARVTSLIQNIPLYIYIANLSKQMQISGLESPKIPIPLFNVINGGKHGAGNLNFQEFFIIPASNKSYPDGLRIGVEIYHKLKEILIFRNAVISVGDEGGFAPNLSTNMDALEAIKEAIRNSNYKLGIDVFLGLDIAATTFFKGGRYQLIDRTQSYRPDEFVDYLCELQQAYKLLVMEDPFGEDEWDSWVKITEKLGEEVFIVGDDLLVTNPARIKVAIEKKACSSILVKLNQIGTVSETLDVIKLSRDAGFKIIISHRSGETTDNFIADFAVGVSAEYVKFGAPARGERVVKYNRLTGIYEELNH